MQYVSPEVLYSKHYNTKKADIYSFGVTLYTLLHHHFPFETDYLDELVKQKLKQKYVIFNKFSNDIVSVINRCLNTYPTMRPSINELFNLLKKLKHKKF
jgi:serine/threonine protein kinase